MIKDLTDLKAITAWMKEQKVAEFKVGDIHIAFAPGAFVPAHLLGAPDEPTKTEEEKKKEDEQNLFWSATH